MKRILLSPILLCAIVFLFSATGNAQQRSAAQTVLRGTGKAAVLVVGTAAKVAWKTTKFTVKHTAVPAAKMIIKPIVTVIAPKATVFVLNLAGKP